MKILVGLKGSGGSELPHRKAELSSSEAITLDLGGKTRRLSASSSHSLSARGGQIIVGASVLPGSRVSLSSPGILNLSLISSSGARWQGKYSGNLLVDAVNNQIKLALELDLERYVEGVLSSEVPASYHGEAMRAQAVLARSYALCPRIDHASDGFNVCDSFLCCQAFNGLDPNLKAAQKEAIRATRGLIIEYEGKPALALFSACAGGHTEDYSNCFSDPPTQQFPAPPIPYLQGIPEGRLPAGFPSEEAMERLFRDPRPATVDSWSPSFRWTVKLDGDAIEAHMHHALEKLQRDPQFAPFICGAGSFGHVKGFSVARRGPSGVAMELVVDTTSGEWRISKELTIRSLFANPDARLRRLRSARIFFKHQKGRLGLLETLTIYGFGSGHGVGLQQVGAQHLASSGMKFEQILKRYYQGIRLGRLA